MTKIQRVKYRGKEILVADYSNCKEAEMISVATELKDLIDKEGKMVLVLSVFNEKNYATPNFVRHIEKEIRKVEHLVDKQAVTGLNDIKIWIVKGLNLWLKKSVKHFDTVGEAFKFLVDDN